MPDPSPHSMADRIGELFRSLASRPHATPRQQAVFDETKALFLEHGFAGFTMEEIAARLRCSKSTIYAIAPSREQLAIAVVVSFFQSAARRIEERVAAEEDPVARLRAYLSGVAAELEPASPAFMEDIAAHPPTRRVYELNTSIAAGRIRELIAAGVEAGVFRPLATSLVAELVSASMVAIQTRQIAAATGLSDAAAYSALAELVVDGIRA